MAGSPERAVASQKALLRYWEASTIEARLGRSVDAFSTQEPRQYMAPFLVRKHKRDGQ